MSTLPVHRQTRSLLPEFADLLATFPSLTGLRPVFDGARLTGCSGSKTR